MDTTTKDIVDTHQNEEENNNVDVTTTSDDQPDSNNTNTNITASPSGLQQIEDDDNDLPLPVGMAEVISNTVEPPKQIGKVEQIDSNDGPEPPTPAAMLEASFNAIDPEVASKITADITNNLSSINELSPPVPFNSANYEDTIAKKITKDITPSTINNNGEEVADEESMYEPPMEIIEGEEGMPDNTNTGRGGTNRRGWDDIEAQQQRRRDQDIESQTRTDNNDAVGSINNDSIIDTESNVVPISTDQEAEDTAIHIPEAFLVEDIDEEVFIATPTLPWWKQRRTKIFFGVVLAIVGALAIALGVSLSSQSNDLGSESTNSTILFVNITSPPTISTAPSLSLAPSTSPPTTAPSSSNAPSISISPSTSPPTITYECFGEDDGGRDGILYDSVRAYIRQDCANNTNCIIGQTYGWPMNSWCVGNVKSMHDLFKDMDTFNENISDWNTSSVTSMAFMFSNANSFNQDVSNFDTSSVTGMSGMFDSASSFNRDLSNFDFDTSSVTNMYSMFRYASLFNGDVSSFDTSRVTTMRLMFAGAFAFNGDLLWNTSSVSSMESMFSGASSFNGDVSSFDTSSVTNMAGMFRYATSFNGDVSNFDTSSVRDMIRMFWHAKSFNQDLCGKVTFHTPPTLTPHTPVTPSPTEAEPSPPQESPVSTNTISSPPSKLTIATFPANITIQGLLWLDENENGLYETDEETPLENIFVNLRKCDGNTYVSTKTTNSNGQYQFTGIDEGEYFVEFFKPSPSSNYDFTLPKVAGNDDKALDSDVIIQNDGKTGGKSDCMVVKEGFNTLTNAGFLRLILKK